MLFCSCNASEKAEKQRLDNAYRSVSVIPPSEEDSEFFNTRFEKQPAPEYPF